MKNLDTMKAVVLKKVEMLQAQAEKVYGCRVPNVQIKYDLNTIRLGGQAVTNPHTNLFKMRLHPAALAYYGEEYVERTVVHEFAHLVQRQNYPMSKPHGKEWKSVMRNLGVEPSRCHSYDLEKALKACGSKPTGRKVKTFTYKCNCQEHQLTAIRHNRVVKGTQTYHCKKCKTTLVPA